METSVRFYNLGFNEAKTYAIASLFLLSNMVLPYLVHLIPMGGKTWLPFYVFILIGAYKYGWKFGLLTAVLSPLLDSLVLGMPSSHVLPVILCKSILLAMAAGFASCHYKKVNIWLLIGVVVFYQAFGFIGEMLIHGNMDWAMSDVVIGWPGLIAQVLIARIVLVKIK